MFLLLVLELFSKFPEFFWLSCNLAPSLYVMIDQSCRVTEQTCIDQSCRVTEQTSIPIVYYNTGKCNYYRNDSVLAIIHKIAFYILIHYL